MEERTVFETRKEFNFGAVVLKRIEQIGKHDIYTVIEFIIEFGKENPTKQTLRSWDDDDVLAYPQLMIELIDELNHIEDGESAVSTVIDIARLKGYQVDEGHRRLQDLRIIEGVEQLAKYTLMADALRELKQTADELYDCDDEETAKLIYQSVISIVHGEEMLPQYIQAMIVKEAEKRGIQLNHSQILTAVVSLTKDLQYTLMTAFEKIVDEVKEHTPTHMMNETTYETSLTWKEF